MRIKGFTLIEIIIIIAIISLLFGASIAYYIQYSEQKKLDTQVQKLDDVLHLMQKKAIAGDIYTSCSNFNGYQVIFGGTNQYSTYFCCNSNCSTLINSYTLDSPLTLVSTNNTIYFKPLIGNIDSPALVKIDITNPTITKCSRITIATSGLMSLTNSCPPI